MNETPGIKIMGAGSVVLGIAATFIGTVVGAGFASGQEIQQFFSIQGFHGFMGIVVAVLILGCAGAKVLLLGLTLKPRSYQELILFIAGPRFGKVIDIILSSFFIILIGVMFSGSGSIFKELGLGELSGAVITAILLLLVLFQELPGLVLANLIVIPLMFSGAILVSWFAFEHRSYPQIFQSSRFWDFNWFIAALQFAAYNFSLAVPVLLALGKKYPFKSTLKWGTWVGCVGLGLMAALINWAILLNLGRLEGVTLPMVELAKSAGSWAYWGFALVLWGEMFTTLLANTYGVAQRLVACTGWPYRFWVLILTGMGMAIAKIGFVNLIAGFYPVYGYICLVILALIFIKPAPRLRI